VSRGAAVTRSGCHRILVTVLRVGGGITITVRDWTRRAGQEASHSWCTCRGVLCGSRTPTATPITSLAVGLQ